MKLIFGAILIFCYIKEKESTVAEAIYLVGAYILICMP